MGKKLVSELPVEALPGRPVRRVEIRVPLVTIVKVLLTVTLAWAVVRLLPELFLFVLAILLGITLAPAVSFLERRGLSRAVAVGVIGVLLLAAVGGFLALVLPSLTAQVSALASNYRVYRERVEGQLATQYPFLKQVAVQILDLPSSPEVAASLKRPLAWGRAAVVGLTGGALLLVLVLYLLLDGKSVYAWLLAYVPREHRKKMAETIPEVSDVVVAYVQGQILTSFLYGLFAFTVLTILRVPASVPLALLAAAGDVIPVLGFIVSAAPAALLALTVSPLTAGVVIVLYSLYHLLENYVIIPRVYGKRLRLSGLAVLVTLIVGGSLFGIPGVLLVLPVVAAYPIVERVWLKDSLSDEVLKDHSALEAAALDGKSDRVVEKVLRGERHSADPVHGVSGRRARAAAD